MLKHFTKALGALLTGLSPFIFTPQGRPGPKGDPGDAGLPGQKVSIALESRPSLRGKREDYSLSAACATSLDELHVANVRS